MNLFQTPRAVLVLCLSLLLPLLAAATATAQSSASSDDLRVTIYPVLAWIPTSIDIDVELPPDDGGGGQIIDSRFDGAFLGGFSVAKGLWRIDADGLWAAVGGDRRQVPQLTVDVDVIYFHVSGGVRVFKDIYATGGVRRLALKYDIKVADLPNFERKPGVWDPLVGIGWHTVRDKFEVHGTFEGGGFGVGSDVELATSFRLDWKPVKHFGLTGGYSLLYFKVEDTVRNRPFTVKQTVHGPVVGIGLYF